MSQPASPFRGLRHVESDFALTGLLEQFSISTGANASSRIQLSEYDSGLGLYSTVFQFIIFGEFDLGSLALNHSGQLIAGTYRLGAAIDAPSHSHSNLGPIGSIAATDFDFLVTPVPEPSTALLVLGGLAALTQRRRRA